MRRRPPRSTRTDTLCPYATLFRSGAIMQTWAISAQKGGQSKTTIATAFAVEAAREGAAVVILDADDRQGSALYLSERRDTDDVMVKDSSVAGLPLHVSRGRDSGKVDLIIIDTPANSKDIAMLAAEQADFVVIPVAPRGLDVHSVLQTVKQVQQAGTPFAVARTSTRSEEHTSELQSLMRISYAVFCLKKKNLNRTSEN